MASMQRNEEGKKGNADRKRNCGVKKRERKERKKERKGGRKKRRKKGGRVARGKGHFCESQLPSDLACKGQSYLHNASRELPPREPRYLHYTRLSPRPFYHARPLLLSSPAAVDQVLLGFPTHRLFIESRGESRTIHIPTYTYVYMYVDM